MKENDLSCVVFGPDGTPHQAKEYADVERVLGSEGQGFAKLEEDGHSVGFVHIGGPHNSEGPPPLTTTRGAMVNTDRKQELLQQWESWVLAGNPERILEGMCKLLCNTYGVSREEAERMILNAFQARKGGNSGI